MGCILTDIEDYELPAEPKPLPLQNWFDCLDGIDDVPSLPVEGASEGASKGEGTAKANTGECLSN